MKARRSGGRLMTLPILVWMTLFVGAALIYVVILSFLTRTPEGFGVTNAFTLDNYRKLLDPKYLKVL